MGRSVQVAWLAAMAQFLMPLKAKLFQLQEFLDFEHAESPHFVDENGAGRHGIAGVGLGLMFGFSAATVLLGSAAGLPFPVIQWCIFTCLLAFFHIGEWYVAAAYRPKELGYRSWIINHSMAYTAAQLAAAVEFWLEWLLIPSIKGHTWLVVLSTLLCIGAIGVRIVGMSQCGSNFDHIVMNHKKRRSPASNRRIVSIFAPSIVLWLVLLVSLLAAYSGQPDLLLWVHLGRARLFPGSNPIGGRNSC